MKVVGLLSWYDENPAWLASCVGSLNGLVSHLVAVDGAYALYPRGRGRSGSEQAEVIRETCRGLGIGLTLHEPSRPWMGNECEKRSALFKLAEPFTDRDDWYMVMDADETVTARPIGFHDRLAETPHDVGAVTFWERRVQLDSVSPGRGFSNPIVSEQQVRILFRAIPGLRVKGRHYSYVTPGGRDLWGPHMSEPVEDFSDLRIEHRSKFRDSERRADAKTYYQSRDELNIEGLIPWGPKVD